MSQENRPNDGDDAKQEATRPGSRTASSVLKELPPLGAIRVPQSASIYALQHDDYQEFVILEGLTRVRRSRAG